MWLKQVLIHLWKYPQNKYNQHNLILKGMQNKSNQISFFRIQFNKLSKLRLISMMNIQVCMVGIN